MKHRIVTGFAALVLLGVGINACSSASGASLSESGASAAEWRPLFDSSFSAWRGYKEQSIPAGWHYANGIISKEKATNDLVTKEEFQNFELTFDWKLHPGGNAGVFYRGSEEFDRIYFSAPEYQLLDDAGHADGKNRLTSAGADYALYPAPAGVVKPANHWNSSRILVNGNHVEHWLNGKKVVQYELGSADWNARLAKSKFADWKQYGRLAKGHIGIQGDHEGALAMRNMRIRTLP